MSTREVSSEPKSVYEIILKDPSQEGKAAAYLADHWEDSFTRRRRGVFVVLASKGQVERLCESLLTAAWTRAKAQLTHPSPEPEDLFSRAVDKLAESLEKVQNAPAAQHNSTTITKMSDDEFYAFDEHLERLHKQLETDARHAALEMSEMRRAIERMEQAISQPKPQSAQTRFASMPDEVASLASEVAAEARGLIGALARGDREALWEVAAKRTEKAISVLEQATGAVPLRIEAPSVANGAMREFG